MTLLPLVDSSAPDFLRTALRQHLASPVLPLDLNGPRVARLDLTAANPRLAASDLRDTDAFERLITSELAAQGADVGVGGYLEDRIIYRRSPDLFGQADARSLHLGVDVWVHAGTAVHSPLPARIHSLADNAHYGDYGPTVILEHELDGLTFYSLYGHLSRREFRELAAGQELVAGAAFATVGPAPENGDWPPHLHFQLMLDLQGRYGDFPGVARPEERTYWAALCPDPNLVLRCGLL